MLMNNLSAPSDPRKGAVAKAAITKWCGFRVAEKWSCTNEAPARKSLKQILLMSQELSCLYRLLRMMQQLYNRELNVSGTRVDDGSVIRYLPCNGSERL